MTPALQPIIIVGAGGCGRGVAQLMLDLNREAMKWKVLGFVTDDADEGRLLQSQGHHWLSTFSDGQYLTKVPNNCYFCPAVGRSALRQKLTRTALDQGLIPATLVHPSAHVADSVDLGEGSIIYANSVINVDSVIGAYALINFSCVVGHDATWADFVSLAPGVLLGGEVSVGEQTMLNIGAKVAPRLHIGRQVAVGAGAVVLENVAAHTTVLGTPARVISQRQQALRIASFD